MSDVSGVTLICSSAELPQDVLRMLNEATVYKVGWEELSNHYGGGKHPQLFCFGAGINYCDEQAIVDAVA